MESVSVTAKRLIHGNDKANDIFTIFQITADLKIFKMYNFRRTEVAYFVKHLKVTNLTNNKFK